MPPTTPERDVVVLIHRSQRGSTRKGQRLTLTRRIKYLLFGKPRDLRDSRLFHRLSLVPFLAWVGLGADGLSSSAYGPEEAFKALGRHTYLAVGLAALMATTVLLIRPPRRVIGSAAGWRLRGGEQAAGAQRRRGIGLGLLVDYVLTITISIAAAGCLFGYAPAWHGARLPSSSGSSCSRH
jgi:hypothetical protein